MGLTVSGALLVLAVRGVRFSEVALALSSANLAWLPLMAAVILGDLCIRSLRWRLILSSAAPGARLAALFRLETIGLAVNNVLFLRLGEVVRAALGGREFRIPVLAVLASVFIERMLDMLSLLLLFAVAVSVQPAGLSPGLGALAAGAAAGAAIVLIALGHADGFIHEERWERRLGTYPRVYRLMVQAAMGTRSLRSWRTAVPVVALGFGLWACDAGLYWAAGRSLGIEPSLDYAQSVLVLATAAAASFLPAVPGSFGTFEQFVKLRLVQTGVGSAAAFGFAGFVHVVNYVLVTGLGIVFLYLQGHTLASLKALGKTEAAPR